VDARELAAWRQAYPHIRDLVGTLQAADAWLSDKPGPGDWRALLLRRLEHAEAEALRPSPVTVLP